MPELRKDPIVGRWVIISTERSKRPSDFAHTSQILSPENCPFCQGNESMTPPEIFALHPHRTQANSPGWEVRVVPSRHPALRIEGELGRHGRGMYDAMNGVGAHEVIIETPEHIPNTANLPQEQIAKVISVCIERMVDLERDPRFKYVLIFKNYGIAAGATTITHSHSQLIATPVNPKRVKEELKGSMRYFGYKERCIYCDMMKEEIESKTRIVVDSTHFIAFCPFASRFPFEVWVLPKIHCADFAKVTKDTLPDLAYVLKTTLMKLSRGLSDPPYNYIIHTSPYRRPKPGYWRTIDQDYHWHIEIMPRLTQVAGFEWGSGVYINPTPPEDAAKYLRELNVE